MKHTYLVCLFQFLTTTLLLSQSNPVPLINRAGRLVSPITAPQAEPQAQARILDQYGKLPLGFEVNQGQTDGRVKFLLRTSGYSLFLTEDEAVLALRGSKKNTTKAKMEAPTAGAVLWMKLRNANPAAKVTGADELAGTSNYFIGNDPTKWQTNVPIYAKVKYDGIYSGIDLVYYGNQRQVEYDFIVAPGADPRSIQLNVRGAKQIREDGHGDLVFQMGEGEIHWHKPVVYQEQNGTKQEIAARYTIADTNRVGFKVARYDASRPLYIDPLIYSTYLGGTGSDQGTGIAVDNAGNAYVTGYTQSTNFPTTNPLQSTLDGGGDAFVAKINPTGSALVYCTYLGGSGGSTGSSIAVDGAGNAYVTGGAGPGFPTVNPLQPAFGGNSDAFVAKINPEGSALVYSTYLGGSGYDWGQGIAVDSSGSTYVTGYTHSGDFPTMNPLQPSNHANGGFNAFLAKLNPAGSELIYSTYLGGKGGDWGYGIAVDSAGNSYVTGYTQSTDFPTMNALQTTKNGLGDAFVAKLSATGSSLVYSTYLGGKGYSWGQGIAVNSAGNAYVTGTTRSSDFPTMNPLQPVTGGGWDAFVSEIDAAGSALVYSTYLGGQQFDIGLGIAVDSAGNAYVIGQTYSSTFPTKSPLQKKNAGAGDVFLAKINPTGSGLASSTYLGGSGRDYGSGIAVDSAGDAYVIGYTTSTNFPTMNPLQADNAGSGKAFVAKIHVLTATTVTLASSPNPSTYGQVVTFSAGVTSVFGAPPDGETVTFMKGAKTLGTGLLSGGSASFTTSTLPVGTYSIKAVYGGDSTLGGMTSKAVKQVVNKAATMTTLASSQNPSSLGQSVTFTASVSPQFSGTVNGTVTFYEGTNAMKTMSLSGGVAKFATKTLTSGPHSITATYNGSRNFGGNSASLTQTVN